MLTASVLSGCVVVPGSGLSSDDAREALYATLDDTQDLLGGQWENRDDPTPRGCLVPLWVSGEQYPGLRLGGEPTDGAEAVDTVRRAWTEWGYRVDETEVGDVIELQGRNGVGELVILRIGENAMTLQGESECRPKQ